MGAGAGNVAQLGCFQYLQWDSKELGDYVQKSNDSQTLIAYQVGDNDIVAAYSPEGAISVLCEVTGEEREEYALNSVERVSDKHLDSLEAFNEDEGTTETLETSLRQDVAKLTKPTYMYGWE